VKHFYSVAKTFLPTYLIVLLLGVGLFCGLTAMAGTFDFPSNYPDIPLEQTPQGYVSAGQGYTLQNVLNIIGQIRNFILIVGVLIILIFIIWGGIDYITARGDETKIKSAKNKIVGALIGAAIVLSAFALLATVRTILSRRSLLGT
jgi:fumarate reductase subunit D